MFQDYPQWFVLTRNASNLNPFSVNNSKMLIFFLIWIEKVKRATLWNVKCVTPCDAVAKFWRKKFQLWQEKITSATSAKNKIRRFPKKNQMEQNLR